MKPSIPSVLALALLAGCTYFDDQADDTTFFRQRPAAYSSRVANVTLGRVGYMQTAPLNPPAFQHYPTDGGLHDNYTISVSPRPDYPSYSGSAPGTAYESQQPGLQNLNEPEPLSQPVRQTPPPPVAARTIPEISPIAKPVAGKPGYVLSPFAPNAGYVDVTGMAPGTEAKDPYTGKIFRVP